MEINLQLSPKQKQAFTILRDKKTTELFYGGGAQLVEVSLIQVVFGSYSAVQRIQAQGG